MPTEPNPSQLSEPEIAFARQAMEEAGFANAEQVFEFFGERLRVSRDVKTPGTLMVERPGAEALPLGQALALLREAHPEWIRPKQPKRPQVNAKAEQGTEAFEAEAVDGTLGLALWVCKVGVSLGLTIFLVYVAFKAFHIPPESHSSVKPSTTNDFKNFVRSQSSHNWFLMIPGVFLLYYLPFIIPYALVRYGLFDSRNKRDDIELVVFFAALFFVFALVLACLGESALNDFFGFAAHLLRSFLFLWMVLFVGDAFLAAFSAPSPANEPEKPGKPPASGA